MVRPSLRKKSKRPTRHVFFQQIIFVEFLLLTITSCVDRPRDNPLDPQNPNTHGKLTGLRLSGREQQIFLSWDRLDINGLAGINIYRLAQGESDFNKINDTPILDWKFVDSNIEYGREYTYQITAETEVYESPKSESKSIVSGPTYTWVADSYLGQVVRFCHDMRYNLFRVGVIAYPTSIAASSSERAAWVLEQYSHRLYKISDNGKLDVVVNDLNAPTSLAVNQSNGDVWIAHRYHNMVSHYNSQGTRLKSITTFQEPVNVDVNEINGDCYVADKTAKKVFRIPIYGQNEYPMDKTFLSPQDVAADPTNHSIWVADSSRVFRYDYSDSGTWIETNGFFWAALLAPCKTSKCCWVVDLNEPGKPAKLLKVDAQGTILFELAEFGNPRGISVNQFDGSCLVADTWYGRLVKVSPDGGNLEYIQNVSGPQDVSVENH